MGRGESCARCGAGATEELRGPPGEWTRYLWQERGVDLPLGERVVPLCADCFDRADRLRTAAAQTDVLGGDQRALAAETERFLDALDVDDLGDSAD